MVGTLYNIFKKLYLTFSSNFFNLLHLNKKANLVLIPISIPTRGIYQVSDFELMPQRQNILIK
jgi:hypothetical protein